MYGSLTGPEWTRQRRNKLPTRPQYTKQLRTSYTMSLLLDQCGNIYINIQVKKSNVACCNMTVIVTHPTCEQLGKFL